MKRKTNGKTVPAHGISKTFTVEPLLVSGFFFLVSLHLPTASRHSSSTLDNMKKTIGSQHHIINSFVNWFSFQSLGIFIESQTNSMISMISSPSRDHLLET
jgi:hypothetical protein